MICCSLFNIITNDHFKTPLLPFIYLFLIPVSLPTPQLFPTLHSFRPPISLFASFPSVLSFHSYISSYSYPFFTFTSLFPSHKPCFLFFSASLPPLHFLVPQLSILFSFPSPFFLHSSSFYPPSLSLSLSLPTTLPPSLSLSFPPSLPPTFPPFFPLSFPPSFPPYLPPFLPPSLPPSLLHSLPPSLHPSIPPSL